MRLSKYPPLFTSTWENNCELADIHLSTFSHSVCHNEKEKNHMITQQYSLGYYFEMTWNEIGKLKIELINSRELYQSKSVPKYLIKGYVICQSF